MKVIHFYAQAIVIILFAALASSCSSDKDVNAESEKKAIETAIRISIGWAADKNLQLLYSVIADDKDYLEVQPSARIVRGIDEFRKNEKFWMDPGFKAVRYEIISKQMS
jgi:hypothetical protein